MKKSPYTMDTILKLGYRLTPIIGNDFTDSVIKQIDGMISDIYHTEFRKMRLIYRYIHGPDTNLLIAALPFKENYDHLSMMDEMLIKYSENTHTDDVVSHMLSRLLWLSIYVKGVARETYLAALLEFIIIVFPFTGVINIGVEIDNSSTKNPIKITTLMVSHSSSIN